jgi:hypothetical protein
MFSLKQWLAGRKLAKITKPNAAHRAQSWRQLSASRKNSYSWAIECANNPALARDFDRYRRERIRRIKGLGNG